VARFYGSRRSITLFAFKRVFYTVLFSLETARQLLDNTCNDVIKIQYYVP